VVDRVPPVLLGAGDQPKPIYPADALAARDGDYVLYVTITIDRTGRVADVVPTWNRLNLPNRFEGSFLEAARTALRAWHFVPARLVYWEKKRGKEDTYLYQEAVTSGTDLKFTFAATGRSP
jgi:hypothetical protein